MGKQRKLQKIQGYCIVCQAEIPYSLYNPVCQNCEKPNAQDSVKNLACHRCTKEMTRPEYFPLCDTCHYQASYVL